MFSWLTRDGKEKKDRKKEQTISLAAIEISDVVETIHVVAYPQLVYRDTRIEDYFVPPGIRNLQRFSESLSNELTEKEQLLVKKGDYFIPAEAYKEYRIETSSSTSYVAEAKLILPELFDREQLSLTFSLPQSYNEIKSHWWHLQLQKGEKNYRNIFPDKVIAELIADATIFQTPDKQRYHNDIGKKIMEVIEVYFLGASNDKAMLPRKERILTLFTKAYNHATKAYSELLAQSTNGTLLKPQHYQFRIERDTPWQL